MNAILKKVEELCGLLCLETPPTAAELAGKLGTVRRQSKSAVYVQPADPSFREVIIGLDPRGGGPKHVELFLADPAALQVGALSHRYGEPQIPPRVSWDSPTSLIYRTERDACGRYLCVIIADLAKVGASGAPADEVRQLTVKRGKR